MNGAERILIRAIEVARNQPHPWTALIQASRVEEGDSPTDYPAAFQAARGAAGESLTKWFEGRRRTCAECVGLLEEALFRVQMG